MRNKFRSIGTLIEALIYRAERSRKAVDKSVVDSCHVADSCHMLGNQSDHISFTHVLVCDDKKAKWEKFKTSLSEMKMATGRGNCSQLLYTVCNYQ